MRTQTRYTPDYPVELLRQRDSTIAVEHGTANPGKRRHLRTACRYCVHSQPQRCVFASSRGPSHAVESATRWTSCRSGNTVLKGLYTSRRSACCLAGLPPLFGWSAYAVGIRRAGARLSARCGTAAGSCARQRARRCGGVTDGAARGRLAAVSPLSRDSRRAVRRLRASRPLRWGRRGSRHPAGHLVPPLAVGLPWGWHPAEWSSCCLGEAPLTAD